MLCNICRLFSKYCTSLYWYSIIWNFIYRLSVYENSLYVFQWISKLITYIWSMRDWIWQYRFPFFLCNLFKLSFLLIFFTLGLNCLPKINSNECYSLFQPSSLFCDVLRLVCVLWLTSGWNGGSHFKVFVQVILINVFSANSVPQC